MKKEFFNSPVVHVDSDAYSEYGIVVTLADGRSAHCKPQGGIWIDDRQVVGTCDYPFAQAKEDFLSN
jgi:hypothetical protein